MKLPYNQYHGLHYVSETDKKETQEWILVNGSGSLKRAREEGLIWTPMYVHERLAWEFGAGFDLYLPDEAREGRPHALPDDCGTTETCWYARRLRAIYAERKMDVRVDVVQIEGGLGIRVTPTAEAIAKGDTPLNRFLGTIRSTLGAADILAPVAIYHPDGSVEVSNPC